MSSEAPLAPARLHIVLFQPEIPQNTGNVGRLCAFTNSRLHLIKPLGFAISDRHLRRSGMDYWYALDLHQHENWAAFRASPAAPKRLWLLTTHGGPSMWETAFAPGDGLLFGNEGHGCPDWLHAEFAPEQRLRVPRFSESPLRSLNLATCVGIVAYEALRQMEANPQPASSQ